MMGIKSIRAQLAVYLVLGFVVMEILAGAGLYSYFDETLERALDTALATKADQIAAALHVEDDGQPHLLLSEAAAAQTPSHREGLFFYQIWRADGSTLVRVGPQGDEHPLPHLENTRKRFGDTTLGNGLSTRATQRTVLPLPDEDEFDPKSPKAKTTPEAMTLIVAYDRHSIDESLTVLLSGLSLMAILVTGGIVGVVSWSVRRGLRPLDDVAGRVDKIGSESLDVRFPVETLPLELQPIGRKLNDLMERLQSAFVRERRFSADVAHELRTPVSELRSLCEVSLRWPDENRSKEAVQESLAIATQMESTINALLSLVRCQAGIEIPQMETINLTLLVNSLWDTMKPAAASRQVEMAKIPPAGFYVESDRGMLWLVVRNLLENAVEHTPAAGSARIEIREEGAKIILRIANTNSTLEPADLSHLFEPFWQKDSARSGQGHEGLGLAIVQEYCRVLGVSIEAGFDEKKLFQVTLVLPRPAHFEAAPTTKMVRPLALAADSPDVN